MQDRIQRLLGGDELSSSAACSIGLASA